VPIGLGGILLLLIWCCARPALDFVAPNAPEVVYIGRVDRRSADAVRFSWPGSQVELRFSGSSIHAVLSDTPAARESRETDRLTVVVDDRPPRNFKLAEGRHLYPLATKLAPTDHRILLWKRTEAEVGVITLHGFQLGPQGRALPNTPRQTRHLEFVGDSVTVGYGNEGGVGLCANKAKAQNNYLTYGAYAARQLSATYTAVAWSGKGLTRNYQTGELHTLPELYDLTIPTESGSPLAPPAPADAVIVNLGTNDFFDGLPDERVFLATYRAFLAKLRKRHPTALLVLAVGPMLADDYPIPLARQIMRRWVRKVRDDWRASGDALIDVIEFWTEPTEGVGCDFHPNIRTHARMGAELAVLLRQRLGW
jgi:lysophospholipase L1-like esterase